MGVPIIPQQTKAFFENIIEEAADSGFIKKPDGTISHVTVIESSRTDCCCCCIGGVSGDRDTFLVVTALFAMFAFFVSLFYTVKSGQSAHQAQRRLDKLETLTPPPSQSSCDPQPPRSSFPPPENPNYQAPNPQQLYPDIPPPSYPGSEYPPSGYTYYPPQPPEHYQNNPQPFNQPPNSEYSPFGYAYYPPQPPEHYPNYPQQGGYDGNYNPQQPPPLPPRDPSCYDDAKTLLTSHRNERIYTAIYQSMLTAGTGFLTVALIITLVIEPDIIPIGLLTSGGGLILLSAAFWAFKPCMTKREEAQEAADRLFLAMIPQN